MVYIGNSLSASQCVTDCGSKIIFFALVQRDECMMQECWTHLTHYVDLAQFAFSPAGKEMCIYGDLAYPLRTHLQCPFRHGVLTRQMEEFNASMSSVRTSVEWLFGDLINYFKFLDHKKNLKIGLSHVGKMYIVCVLLRNALTCLYRNTTADYFGLDPPPLIDYFS